MGIKINYPCNLYKMTPQATSFRAVSFFFKFPTRLKREIIYVVGQNCDILDHYSDVIRTLQIIKPETSKSFKSKKP